MAPITDQDNETLLLHPMNRKKCVRFQKPEQQLISVNFDQDLFGSRQIANAM
jgi:hypothetical protein